MTLRNRIHPGPLDADFSQGMKFNPAQFESIVQKLDAADGKVDGKINKSIWNAYAEQVGGNQIKNYITTDNALKALNRYFENDIDKNSGSAIFKYGVIPEKPATIQNTGVKPAQKSGASTGTAFPEGSDAAKAKVTPRPANDKNVPKTKTPPSNEAYNNRLPEKLLGGDPQIPNLRPIEDGNKALAYDENGYVRQVLDFNACTSILFERDKNGNIQSRKETDKNGKVTSEIKYDKDGKIKSYVEYKYNDKGGKIAEIRRDANGKVTGYDKWVNGEIVTFDANGKATKRNEFGGAFGTAKYKKDEGNFAGRIIEYNKDGTVTVYDDLNGSIDDGLELKNVYDKNGNELYYEVDVHDGNGKVKYKPDGTKWEE